MSAIEQDDGQRQGQERAFWSGVMREFQKLGNIKAVVFDVFGTLVEIGQKRRPYRKLLDYLVATGRPRQSEDAVKFMSHNVGLAGAAQLLAVEIPAATLAAIELDLYAELATIRLFPDAAPCLIALREAGYKVGLCSNLSAPYAIPVKLLLPFELDYYAWSFEVGAIKPAHSIFEKVCSGLSCAPHEVMMIGDTFEADYTGPRQVGMQSIHLARNGNSPALESIQSLSELLKK